MGNFPMSHFKTLKAQLTGLVGSGGGRELQGEIVSSLSFTQPGSSRAFDEPRSKK